MFLHLGCLKEMLMVTYSHKCKMLECALGVMSMYRVCSRGKGGWANMMVSFLLFVQHFVFAFFFFFSEAGF